MKEVDFERERQWWDAKAAKEEDDLLDEAVNRALRWREIERHLEGVDTILDVGAATGAFSIPLARRGYSVTHLDLSPRMLEIARQKAQGLTTIRFVDGNAAHLSQFPNRSFDLVLNMDGAISFCGSEAELTILESCRVTKRKLIITVTHRRRVTAFLPGELRAILERAGMRVLRCGGLGSLAYLCRPETIERVVGNDALFGKFLDLCDRFDREVLPDGPGTRQRAGLIAVAEVAGH